VAVFGVSPSVDGGTHPVKRVRGDVLTVSAFVVADGHDVLAARVLHQSVTGPDAAWQEQPMHSAGNDRFAARIPLLEIGPHEFVVEAWIDEAATWQHRIERKRAAGVSTTLDVASLADAIARGGIAHLVRTDPHPVTVERELAGCSAWYELFPRSLAVAPDGGEPSPEVTLQHGTLRDVIGRLDHIAELGFDVVYLPPIHPIGRTHRKGRDNSLHAEHDDVGSPWAIGAAEGGHTAVHPELGTDLDLEELVLAARDRGLEIALDLAFQCSPDHPWITEHPEWFVFRADGSVAHAENPPKLYQDIVPLDFDSVAWRELWQALADVVRHWRARGVRVFRVDNPHTKPFAFWQWLIDELHRDDPGIVFLAEAFASPTVMAQLAKVGFSQSYCHFPWQYSPADLRQYFEMVTHGEAGEYLRASSWPNTPDILTAELQQGVRAAFVERLVLAATLSAAYGIYGPPYELMEHVARSGAEEYARNEKFELRAWPLGRDGSLAPEIARINHIRRTHRALQHDRSLVFHHCDDPAIVVFSKTAPDRVRRPPSAHDDRDEPAVDDPILVVASTDHWNVRGGMVRLDLAVLGDGPWDRYEAHDLFGGQTYTWQGADNVVVLDPAVTPVHVLRLRPHRDAGHDGHGDPR
jgi:starch synthase (maltosyl-transferring)